MKKIKLKKPSKKVVKRVAVMAIAFTIVAGSGAIVAQNVYANYKNTNIADLAKQEGIVLIKEQEAIEIALNEAGMKPEEVKHLEVELDLEDDEDDDQEDSGKEAKYEYEVEFTHNGVEYEYCLNAETKEIIHFSIDK